MNKIKNENGILCIYKNTASSCLFSLTYLETLVGERGEGGLSFFAEEGSPRAEVLLLREAILSEI